MSLKIFKPNANSTGALFSFNFGPAQGLKDLKGEISLFVGAVLQSGWNAATKRASFKENAKNPAKTIRIKLNEFEMGSIINCIKRRTEFKGYHSHASRAGSVQFFFSPSLRDNVFQGFTFSILRDGKDKFFLPISAGEAEALLIFLDFGLKTLYSNRFKTQGQQSSYSSATSEETHTESPQEPVETVEEQPVPTEDPENPFGP